MEQGIHWVFGYGSLIWHPGFDFLLSRPAVLHGAHRSLCIYSHRHRGTAEQPGLVFGLLQGGSCRGMAFGVAGDDWPKVYDYLMAREQDTGVYREAMRPVRLNGGGTVLALAFLVDVTHVQFAGRLDVGEQMRMVRAGFGQSGANIDYVLNTARHLREMGISDRHLTALVALLTGPASASS